jgi:hypothetical protein
MSAACRSALAIVALLPLYVQAQGVALGPTRPQSPAAPDPNAARYTVSGTVVNSVTGAPIPRAVVRLQGLQIYAAFSGDDGRFQIQNVPEGTYSPVAIRPGFQSKGGIVVTVGAAMQPVNIKLDPECSVQGHVVDENGDPLENVFVHLTQIQIVNGHKRAFGGNGANTDDNGDFEIENLSPGRYLVETNQTPLPFTIGTRGRGARVYPAQYFPETTDASAAQVMSLQPGESLRADFRLTAVPAYRVSGTATPVTGNLTITVEDAEGHQTGVYGFRGNSGRWVIRAMPAGTWMIVLSSQDQRGNRSVGRIPVTIGNENVEGVQALLQPVPNIPVHIDSAGANQSLQVKLVSRDENSTEVYARYDPQNESTPLAFIGVDPGTYAVYVNANGTNCVNSVSSAGSDLTRTDLIVSPESGSAPIDIAERTDCGSIELSAPPTLAAQRWVILTSDAPAFEARSFMMQSGAAFWVTGLTPGTYKLYTVDDLSDLEFANPEALRNLVADEIELSPNQQAQFTVSGPETAEAH